MEDYDFERKLAILEQIHQMVKDLRWQERKAEGAAEFYINYYLENGTVEQIERIMDVWTEPSTFRSKIVEALRKKERMHEHD